jgi:hypothetical protein
MWEMSTRIKDYPTTTKILPIKRKEPIKAQLVDPFFDKRLKTVLVAPLTSPIVDSTNMINRLMRRVDPLLQPAGWADFTTMPSFQTMEKRNLGALTNIIKADVVENTNAYLLDAGV